MVQVQFLLFFEKAVQNVGAGGLTLLIVVLLQNCWQMAFVGFDLVVVGHVLSKCLIATFSS
jgi:hypothetical protein